jgi:uncharacterized protein YegL
MKGENDMATEIVFVLDRSGSMNGLESDVIGGFNSFLLEQQKLKGKARLTTILFDDKYEILHNGMDIKNVNPITEKEYFVRGMTALLDAIGKTITTVRSHTKKKDKVLFIINTDGKENSSVEYSHEKIKELVKECEEKNGWKFMFLGAGIDAFAIGKSMEILTTGAFNATKDGMRSFYKTINVMTSTYRNTGNIDESELDGLK